MMVISDVLLPIVFENAAQVHSYITITCRAIDQLLPEDLIR